ncbi:hypothetical protein [Wenjunlia tyrosinilytica]|uniref:Lipoprotein n=1 Tax=Wenjunlia tyrosinilytica TaxID=1544741 RepID=A0A918DY56_9ACTN|nr:hypothetical protein [Wenjunlia tyrosinilytica]GGO88298.1 lipoprotein [Wenjunlia tyrosinilytica]
MHHHSKRTALAAACTAAAIGLVGCGTATKDAGKSPSAAPVTSKPAAKEPFAGLSGPRIADKALAATRSASSMTLRFDGTSDGEHITAGMALDKRGDCVGDLTMPQGGIRIIKTGDTAYMKYDDAMWKSQGKDGATAASVIGDRWIKTSAADPDFKDLGSMCDLEELLAGFDGDTEGSQKGRLTVLDGKPVVPLVEKDGKEVSTAYIAAEGKPYILKITTEGGKEPGTAEFADYDKPVNAQAPSPKNAVDLAKLGG